MRSHAGGAPVQQYLYKPVTPRGGSSLSQSDEAMASDTRAVSVRHHPFSALRHRSFLMYFSGQVVSLIGSWMQTMAQGWLVLELTNSAFLLGLLQAVQFLPQLLLSLFAGVVVDRVDKRRLIIFTQSMLALQALVLAVLVWTGRARYWHVLILALVYGLVNTIDTPGRQAFVVEMVGREDLMNAIALNSSAFNGARIVGPAVAGLVIGAVGMGMAFFLNGVSFLAVIAALVFMQVVQKARPVTRGNTILGDVAEGIQYIVRAPDVMLPMLLIGLVSLFGMNFNIWVPVLAKIVLHEQATGYGFLMSFMGAGALTGALALASVSHRGPQRSYLFGGAAALGALEILAAILHGYWISSILLFWLGFSMITISATANSMIQMVVPDHLRGRVMAVYSLVFGGVTPLGALLAGSVTSAWGIVGGFGVGGATTLASLAAVWVWYRKAMARRSMEQNLKPVG